MSDDKSPLGFHNSKMSGDKTSHKDIFQDKDNLLEIWKEERRSRDVSVGLMWENLRLYSVLIPAIITVYILFLRLIYDPSMKGSLSTSELLIVVVSWALPVVVIVLSTFGIFDLYGRWNRTLEAIAHLRKLEKLLGLDDELAPDKRVFKDDTFLFQRYNVETKDIPSEDKFIKKNILKFNKFKFNMFTRMMILYVVFGFIGAVLLYYRPVGQ